MNESKEQTDEQATRTPPANQQPESALRLVGTLTAVTVISAAVLASGHVLTRNHIKAARQRMKNHGISRVLPRCVNDPLKDAIGLDDPRAKGRKITVYRCKQKVKGGIRTVAVAVDLDSAANKHKPYSGLIRVLVGIDVQTGKVRTYQAKKGPDVAVVILKHTETPGLGSKIEDYAFRRAFASRDLKGKDRTSDGKRWAVKKDDAALGFVDAISGATISSRAITELVHRALQLFGSQKTKILEGKATGPVTPPPVLEPPVLPPKPGGKPIDRRKRPLKVSPEDLRHVLPACAIDPLKAALEVSGDHGKQTIVFRCFQRRQGRLVLAAVAVGRNSIGNKHKPYGGLIQVLVGIDATSGKIPHWTQRKPAGVGVVVLKHSETQDLGSDIETYGFLKVFAGADLKGSSKTSDDRLWAVNTDEKKAGGFIDSLSGATISSVAVMELVRRSLAIWNANQVYLRLVPPPGVVLPWDPWP